MDAAPKVTALMAGDVEKHVPGEVNVGILDEEPGERLVGGIADVDAAEGPEDGVHLETLLGAVHAYASGFLDGPGLVCEIASLLDLPTSIVRVCSTGSSRAA